MIVRLMSEQITAEVEADLTVHSTDVLDDMTTRCLRLYREAAVYVAAMGEAKGEQG